MKSIIMTLTILLIAVVYIVQISPSQATNLQVHELSFADSSGAIIHSEVFVEGTDLSTYELPEAPVKDGFVFVGWSYDFSQGMPDANVIIYPQYMHSVYTITTTIK
ncbi:MAG: InlB B-repeat-containing protein [Firmicutes bacterium]|nr:InlB B-repeat-containing protein [Bacillota bacterium]